MVNEHSQQSHRLVIGFLETSIVTFLDTIFMKTTKTHLHL